jgi:hypothetical protein
VNGFTNFSRGVIFERGLALQAAGLFGHVVRIAKTMWLSPERGDEPSALGPATASPEMSIYQHY